ncbi:MAG: ABC transporter, partial [Alphaproteobacteria bacterium]
LQNRIEETETKMTKLQQEEQATGVLLTAEQQAEIDDFRAEMLQLRRELRDVQHSLRQDVETLQSNIRIINIWAIPVLVAIVAVVLALVRRMRRARFHRAALH